MRNTPRAEYIISLRRMTQFNTRFAPSLLCASCYLQFICGMAPKSWWRNFWGPLWKLPQNEVSPICKSILAHPKCDRIDKYCPHQLPPKCNIQFILLPKWDSKFMHSYRFIKNKMWNWHVMCGFVIYNLINLALREVWLISTINSNSNN